MEFVFYISREELLLRVDKNSTHIYFGCEFCEKLIPSPESVERAVKFYSEILKFFPGDGEVHKNTGKIYLTLTKYEESASHLNKAVQILPGDAVTHNLLGKALMYRERKAEAEKHFSEALRLKPGFMEAHVNLAICLRAQGHLEEAAEQLEKAKALINK